MKEFKDKEYNTRDEQGIVKVGLNNVTTNNMKRGFGNTTVGHLFSSSKYQGDPYDDQRDIERQEKIKHKSSSPSTDTITPPRPSPLTTPPTISKDGPITLPKSTRAASEASPTYSGMPPITTKKVTTAPSPNFPSTLRRERNLAPK